MSKITDIVLELAKPIAEAQGCSVWDVEYIKEVGTYYLRVYIDKEGGVSINDCEAVSRALDPVLEEADPIPTSYTFEVSSAGAERQLNRPSDFERYMGANVEIKHYQPVDGAKFHIGKLVAYEDGDVSIEVSNKIIKYNKAQVAQVKLRATI